MLHRFKFIFLASIGITQLLPLVCKAQSKPNIVIIYTDDLGVGDISANGATKVKTPNIDRIANRFSVRVGCVVPRKSRRVWKTPQIIFPKQEGCRREGQPSQHGELPPP